jgi:hypothetical protein
MSIAEGYKTNFETLKLAMKYEDVCLMECTDVATKKPAIVICAVNRPHDDKGEFVMVPIAKMFDGNPYDELEPPV